MWKEGAILLVEGIRYHVWTILPLIPNELFDAWNKDNNFEINLCRVLFEVLANSRLFYLAI